jgi:crossover junction endodeoxyribonuclease RusA
LNGQATNREESARRPPTARFRILHSRPANFGPGTQSPTPQDVATASETAAVAAWPPGRLPFTVEVKLRITHYSERRVADMDNLVKPIQDALQGVVYLNDGKVDVAGNQRDINGRFHVRYISPPLAAAFTDGSEFVHIRVWLVTVSFG